jgi:hypothetical protein
MIGLTMLLIGGMWILGLWKAVECFKWGLMGYPHMNMEDIYAKGYLNCGDLIQGFSFFFFFFFLNFGIFLLDNLFT